MEAVFNNWTPIISIAGFIGVAYKSYSDIQKLEKRVDDHQTFINSISNIQKDISEIHASIGQHDALLVQVGKDLVEIKTTLRFIKESITTK